MAVSIADISVASAQATGVMSISTSITITPKANRGGIIGLAIIDGSATDITVSMAGTPGVLIPGTDTTTTYGIRHMLFSVAAPSSGVQTVSASWSGITESVYLGAVATSGVDQSTPANNGGFASGRFDSPTINAASNSGDLTVSLQSGDDNTVRTPTTQTLLWNRAGVATNYNASMDRGPGTAGPITHTWSSSLDWLLSAANFKQVDPQILWSAGMETGNLSEWSEQVNDPGCTTELIGIDGAVHPHGGNFMMKQIVNAASGGTRMQRYPEVDALSRSQTTYYYSFYHYLPSAISYGIFDTYIVWGLNSKAATGSPGDPIWSLVLASSDGTGALDLIWSPNDKAPDAGPHANESGGKRTYAGLAANRLPIGQWNFIEIMITPAPDFTGAIKIWQNGTLIHDQSPTSANGLRGVKTQWPISVPAQDLLAWFEQAGYGSGLTPTPTIAYVDDVTVSLNRLAAG
jgi:hypothetical protein